MKKRTLYLLPLALLICSISFAQDLHVGVKAGANIFKVDGKSFKEEFTFGYNAGAFVEIDFSKKWGIQPELMWNQLNYRTGNEFNNVFPGGVNDVKGKLNYLSIPLLLSYKPAKIISIQAGPQFGVLINQDKSLFQNGKEAFKTGDLSLLGGLQLNLGGWKVGGRYVVGLSDINDVDNKEKWRNQGFQLYVGVRII